MRYWIKERHNPQLGVYYVALGQMTAKRARTYEDTAYGFNIVHGFKTKTGYEKRLADLRAAGRSVQG